MATVVMPPQLRKLVGGQERLEVEASTVRAAIEALDGRHPGLAARLIDGDRLRSGLAVAVDGEIGERGLAQKLEPGSLVQFVPAIAGG